jgi:hypothetical protein
MLTITLALGWGLLFWLVVQQLSRPRISFVQHLLLCFTLGLLGTHPWVWLLLPVLVGLSLLAAWPLRAFHTALWAACLAIVLHTCGPLVWGTMWPNPWPKQVPWISVPLAGWAFVLLGFGTALYHWRWWSPAQQLCWSLSPLAVVLAPYHPSLLFAVLPLLLHTGGTWWQAQQRRKTYSNKRVKA